MKKIIISVMTGLIGMSAIAGIDNKAEAAADINYNHVQTYNQPNIRYTQPVYNTRSTYTTNIDTTYQRPVVRNTGNISYIRQTTTPVRRTTTPKQYAPKTNAVIDNNVKAIALQTAIGKSYVYGANSATAVDCSAFAQQVLAKFGKAIPRTTYAQMAVGTPVTNPQPGDLVYFNGGSHVGVYVGNGQMVDALNPRLGIGLRDVAWISGSVTGYYRF